MNKLLLIALCLLSGLKLSAQSFSEEALKYRESYLQGFIDDEHSPLKKEDLSNLHFFEPDSTFRVQAKVTLLKDQKPFKMATFDGTSKEFVKYAILDFELNGQPYQLTLYRNPALSANAVYKDYLFLPFTDETNNKETYGGGRYIDLKTSDIVNNSASIDFNRAYNPYCAYSTGYRCPVPPQENDLAISITAGEKLYTGEKKHRQ